MTLRQGALRGLIDLDHGLINREVFVNDDIYKLEQEQIFARAWLFVGHESQVRKPGDFFVSRMGEESVILVRSRNQQLHVFLNTCRHRGMKVCRYDEGNTILFTCPFHGWSYDTEGKLVGVPHFKEAYHEALDKSQWGLVEVAQLANYKGSIWATWDPKAPSFLDWLGDYEPILAPLFDGDDGREGGTEVLGVHKWRMPTNWKFPATSFGGDAAHAISHKSTHVADYGPQGEGDRHGAKSSWPTERVELSIPGLGHGAHVTIHQPEEPYTPTWQTASPVVEEYFRAAYQECQRRRKGEKRLEAGSATVWPNASFSGGVRRTIVVWNPDGTQMTEAWRFYLVDAKTPPEGKDALRRYHMRYGGPVGMTEQDDMENWNYASAASVGTIARRYPYNYQMGIGHVRTDGSVAGQVSQGRSEQGQRARFARWLEFMEASSWDDVYPKNAKPVRSR
ncbi:MAG: aromatic ring-hydroxylating oxygenase subunit alpha [Candidatus Binatia bacterium]